MSVPRTLLLLCVVALATAGSCSTVEQPDAPQGYVPPDDAACLALAAPIAPVTGAVVTVDATVSTRAPRPYPDPSLVLDDDRHLHGHGAPSGVEAGTVLVTGPGLQSDVTYKYFSITTAKGRWLTSGDLVGIDEGTVLVVTSTVLDPGRFTEQANLYALHPDTGKTRWCRSHLVEGLGAEVDDIAVAGTRAYLSDAPHLWAVDAATGDGRWRLTWAADGGATYVVADATRVVAWTAPSSAVWRMLVLDPEGGAVIRNLEVALPSGTAITDVWLDGDVLLARTSGDRVLEVSLAPTPPIG